MGTGRAVLLAGVVAAVIASTVGLSVGLREGSSSVITGLLNETGLRSSGQPSVAASPPPKPRITMATVRKIGRPQQFRAYSGPTPPAVSEKAALNLAEIDGDRFSLGLWDVGMVHLDKGVVWHSVWVIAGVNYSEDLNGGGASGGSALSANESQPPHPGWSRAVHMIDAQTGEFFLAYVF